MATDAAAATAETAAVLAATPLTEIVAASRYYWQVKLVRPGGGSPGLLAYIGMAEAAIQTAVDLLGRGMPQPPPQVDDLLRPIVLANIGKGAGVAEYEKTVTAVQARQTTLRTMDAKVLKTSVVVAAEQNDTLRAIKTIVTELNTALKAAGAAKLRPAQEKSLLERVADAVEAVYAKVDAVAELNENMAGADKSGGGAARTGTGSGTTAGGGGGDGGLGGLLPMLAMLPMAAIPLLAQLPELLEQQEPEEDEEKKGENPPGGTEPAPPPPEPVPV